MDEPRPPDAPPVPVAAGPRAKAKAAPGRISRRTVVLGAGAAAGGLAVSRVLGLHKLGPDEPRTSYYLNSRAYLHHLGDDADKDSPVFGNGLSSSPSNMPPPLDRGAFPNVTVYDNVVCQHRLVTEHLGITHLKLVVG